MTRTIAGMQVRSRNAGLGREMRASRRTIALWPASLLALIVTVSPPASAAESNQTERIQAPVESKRCVIEGRFDCDVYERVFHVRGASCREDCALRNNLDNCVIQHRCQWDAVSGCFRKAVCTQISNLGTCRRWEVRVICGR